MKLLGFLGVIGVKFLCGLLFEFSAVVGITVGGSDAMQHPGVLQAVGKGFFLDCLRLTATRNDK